MQCMRCGIIMTTAKIVMMMMMMMMIIYNHPVPTFLHITATVSHRFVVYYPQMPIGKVWIYRLLFVCLSVCLYGYGFLRRG